MSILSIHVPPSLWHKIHQKLYTFHSVSGFFFLLCSDLECTFNFVSLMKPKILYSKPKILYSLGFVFQVIFPLNQFHHLPLSNTHMHECPHWNNEGIWGLFIVQDRVFCLFVLSFRPLMKTLGKTFVCLKK